MDGEAKLRKKLYRNFRKSLREQFDIHHVYSKRRFPQYKSVKWNKVRVPKFEHIVFHNLFEDKTPEEQVNYLARNFWGSDQQVIDRVINTLSNLRRTRHKPTRGV